MAWFESDIANLVATSAQEGDCQLWTGDQDMRVRYRGGMVDAHRLAYAYFVCDDLYPQSWPAIVVTCSNPRCLTHLRPLKPITGDVFDHTRAKRFDPPEP